MAEDSGWEIVPLGRSHERAAFDCGEPALDAFLARYARQNQELGISRTYVAVRPGSRAVAGFFTLASGSVEFAGLPEDERRGLPRYPVPVIHLARLAVDRAAAGQGLGERLLVEALRLALHASEGVGAYAIDVVAKSAGARGFYRKYGFMALRDDEDHLYMPMRTVRAALDPPE